MSQAGRERIVRILDTLHLEEVYVSPAIARREISRSRRVRGHRDRVADLFDDDGTPDGVLAVC